MSIKLDELIDNKIKILEEYSGEGFEPEISINVKEIDKNLLTFFGSVSEGGQQINYFNLSIPILIENIIFPSISGEIKGLLVKRYEKIEEKIENYEMKINILKKKIDKFEKIRIKKYYGILPFISKVINKKILKIESIWKGLTNRYYSNAFFKELISSKVLLDLKDNWDGEGSRGFRIKTWNKLSRFLIQISKKFYIENKKHLLTPFIDPGLNGGFDVHWKTDKFELFLTIPESDDNPISYYGDDYGNNIIKGTIDINNFDIISSWMKTFH